MSGTPSLGKQAAYHAALSLRVGNSVFFVPDGEPDLLSRVRPPCARACPEIVPEGQPAFPIRVAQAHDVKMVHADIFLGFPDEQVAYVDVFSRWMYPVASMIGMQSAIG